MLVPASLLIGVRLGLELSIDLFELRFELGLDHRVLIHVRPCLLDHVRDLVQLLAHGLGCAVRTYKELSFCQLHSELGDALRLLDAFLDPLEPLPLVEADVVHLGFVEELLGLREHTHHVMRR